MSKKTIFIHSLFRTGSTYIWNKFREDSRYHCYYEPFHQDLVNLDFLNPDPWRYDKKCTQLMRHPDLNTGYLNEYTKSLRPDTKGVPFFKKSFSFDDFCVTDKEKNPDQKEYIDFLIRQAGEKTPVLQFNRSSLRISWFKANYPEGLHIYLVRSPRDQFHSYMDMFNQVGLDSFLTMDLIVTGVNQNHDFFKPLSAQMPLFEFHSDLFEHERFIYSRLLPVYSSAEKYYIFYFTWFLALMENGLNADFLLNIDLLSHSTLYRDAFHRRLHSWGINTINFSDSKITDYKKTVLHAQEMKQIEETVQSLILQRYTYKQIDSFNHNLGETNREFFKLDSTLLRELKKKKVSRKTDINKEVIEKYQLVFKNFFHQLVDQHYSTRNLENELRKQLDEASKLKKDLEHKDRELMQKDRQLEEKDQQLERKDQQVIQKDQVLEQKDRQLKQKEKQLEQKDQQVIQKDQVLELKEKKLEQKDQQIAQQDRELEQKNRQLKKKEQQLEQKEQQVMQKGRVLEQKNRKLKHEDNRVKTLQEEKRSREQEIREKDTQIEALTNQLTLITSNRFYKMLTFLKLIDREKMNDITIAHIINPFIVKRDSDLFTAQPVTFETMKAARDAAGKGVKVQLFAAFYPEDETMVPDHFSKTRPLDRSVLDAGTIKGDKQRKLPLIKDILDRLYEESSADYFIYSNVDIALMPDFYNEVKNIINSGYDGFVINRRTISNTYSEVEDIPRMMAEARSGGEIHPGFDCFVFKREHYKHFRFGTACVGANWAGRVMVSNIMAFAHQFKVFEDLHLTFHIGDDRPWLENQYDNYNQHNENQVLMILDTLMTLKDVKNKETLNEIYTYLVNVHQTRQSIPPNIVERNSPVYQLPDKPENIYHTDFRYSLSWEKYDRQLLGQDPIFIVGYPRSGTTLVQALLATQENIYSFYETHFFSIVRKQITVKDKSIVPECLDHVTRKIRERIAFSKNAEAHVKKLAQNDSLSVKMLFEILVIDNLINKVNYKKLKHIRWMEKTPEHGLYLDVIFRFYPGAKVIHVLRHPEKAILSRRRHFTFNNEAAWLIEKHVQKWLECVRAIEKSKNALPDSVLMVKLEDITRDTAAEMQKICKFLDIPFDKTRLDNYKEISRALYYPWETWKNSASEEISDAVASRKYYHLSFPDRAKLQMMAGKEMKKYGYNSSAQNLINRAGSAARKRFLKLKRSAHRFRDAISPLFKTYDGKINMAEQLRYYYGQHRSGWIYAVECLRELHNPRGVFFDAFIERSFAWRPDEIKAHLEPWIGFIHVPPHVPEWFQGGQSNENIFKTGAWEKSIPLCRGLYTLSSYHRKYLESKLAVPVNNLLFPTEIPDLKWSWERFAANKEKKIVQIGWWLRKIHSIYQLPVHNYKKIFLKVTYFDWDDLIQKERDILKKQGTFREEMYDTAETVQYLPNREYDRLLSENIVFINLYDSSANNTIIECIARNTPILVNPLEAVVEYLGEDYPFYFNSLEEAVQKAEDDDLVYKTYQYLLNHPIKEKLTGEYFLKSFKESENYRTL